MKIRFKVWNIVCDGDVSNEVGFKMAVTCFFAIEGNMLLLSKSMCLQIEICHREKSYEKQTQFPEWNMCGVIKLVTEFILEWSLHASWP